MFKFRLQRVLDLRVQREQETALRLAQAQSAEEEARRECARLESAREEGAQRAAATGQRPTVGQLQHLRFVVERLNDQVERAHQDASAAAQTVRARMQEFTTAFQERRVMDRLRDRDQEGWKADEVQADRQTMDGIALTRFIRSRPGNPSLEA